MAADASLAVDPEDQATELWAPAAASLFEPPRRGADESAAAEWARDAAPVERPAPAVLERDDSPDGDSPTMLVEGGRGQALSCECRICGRKVAAPRPQHLRGPAGSKLGFVCELCGNAFCAAHVRRVSGLWESMTRRARFRCVLCLPTK